MKTSALHISQILLDFARVSEVVLSTTPIGHAALQGTSITDASRALLERVDGLRSIEQLLALPGNPLGIHGELGELLASGYVHSESLAPAETSPSVDAQPAAPAASSDWMVPTGQVELDYAKLILLKEARQFMGPKAEKLQQRIGHIQTTEEIYDLIVKVRSHIAKTGKAQASIFLEQLIDGLALARSNLRGEQLSGSE